MDTCIHIVSRRRITTRRM